MRKTTTGHRLDVAHLLRRASFDTSQASKVGCANATARPRQHLSDGAPRAHARCMPSHTHVSALVSSEIRRIAGEPSAPAYTPLVAEPSGEPHC